MTISKRVIALFLVLILSVPLVACGMSKEAKECQKLIKSIPEELNIDNFQVVLDAQLAYISLSPDEQSKIKTDKLDAAKKTLFEADWSPIMACSKLKKYFKDPTSIRIFDDILLTVLPGEKVNYIISVYCDGKNSLGYYPGSDDVEIYYSSSRDIDIASKDSNFFANTRSLYNSIGNLTEENQKELETDIIFRLYSGEAVASIIGCEYIK